MTFEQWWDAEGRDIFQRSEGYRFGRAAWHTALAQRPEATTPEWKAVGENGPHLGVAWIDWDATHIGKIGVKGQRHILKLPFIERPPRKG